MNTENSIFAKKPLKIFKLMISTEYNLTKFLKQFSKVRSIRAVTYSLQSCFPKP